MATFCDKFVIFMFLLSIFRVTGSVEKHCKSGLQNVFESKCAKWFSAFTNENQTIDTKRNHSIALIRAALLTSENARDYLTPALYSKLQITHSFPGDVPHSFGATNNIQYVGIQCIYAHPIKMTSASQIEIMDDTNPDLLSVDGLPCGGFQDTILLKVNVTARSSSLQILCAHTKLGRVSPEYETRLLITVDNAQHLAETRLYLKSKMLTPIEEFYAERGDH